MTRNDTRPVWHLYPNGDVERAPVRSGHIGYRWVQGYSQVTGPRSVTMPLTRREWYAMARRDGARCLFHPHRTAARLAAWPVA